MDMQQVQYFKQLVDYIDKDNILNINVQWKEICSEFNIDTLVYPPKEQNGATVVCDPKKYQIDIKIRELIADKPSDLSEVFDLMNMLYYEQIINEVDNNIYISIASRLRDALNGIDTIGGFSKIIVDENWQTAIALLFIVAEDKYDYNYISQQKTRQAYSIKYLIKLGFDIDWKERPTTPILPDTEIVNRIERLMTPLEDTWLYGTVLPD
jgi:hypothetical protein